MSDAPILVVDDDPCIRGLVSEALDWEGYQVVTAANGAEALRLAEAEPPALVLLDMQMPVLDGPGFIRALQARGLRPPVLVFTAAGNARGHAGELNAAGFIPKPFDLTLLLDTVAHFCSKAVQPYVDARHTLHYEAVQTGD